jgi:hypothetical protein
LREELIGDLASSYLQQTASYPEFLIPVAGRIQLSVDFNRVSRQCHIDLTELNLTVIVQIERHTENAGGTEATLPVLFSIVDIGTIMLDCPAVGHSSDDA